MTTTKYVHLVEMIRLTPSKSAVKKNKYKIQVPDGTDTWASLYYKVVILCNVLNVISLATSRH